MRPSRVAAARLSVLALIALLTPLTARAQLGGAINLGAMGVGSGTQPDPGLYVGFFYYRYSADTTMDGQGRMVPPDPGQSSGLTERGYTPLLYYVSRAKIFGATWGFLLAPTFAGASLRGTGPGVSRSLGTGVGDLYCVPVNLGWHAAHADFSAGFGFYAPTGRYTAGADNNLGNGMWSEEWSAGTTVFFDKARTWSLAASVYWELHSRKTATEQTGQILSLQGGFGKAYLRGAVKIGVAYDAQWKLTRDRFDASAGLPSTIQPADKHRVYALGPDVTVPLASKSVLVALFNIRYLREFDVLSRTQGGTLVAMIMFPVPSIPVR